VRRQHDSAAAHQAAGASGACGVPGIKKAWCQVRAAGSEGLASHYQSAFAMLVLLHSRHVRCIGEKGIQTCCSPPRWLHPRWPMQKWQLAVAATLSKPRHTDAGFYLRHFLCKGKPGPMQHQNALVRGNDACMHAVNMWNHACMIHACARHTCVCSQQ